MILALLFALTSARVDAIARDALSAGATGVQIAVIQRGKVIFDKGYGLANVELKVPLRADAPVRIASITKQFTAASVLRLVEQGKLHLDTPLGEVLPDFPLQGHAVTDPQSLNRTLEAFK